MTKAAPLLLVMLLSSVMVPSAALAQTAPTASPAQTPPTPPPTPPTPPTTQTPPTAQTTAQTIEQEIARAIDSDTMRLVAEATRRGLRRFRRSVTLGPTVSAGASLDIEEDDGARTYLSGGLALLHYDIPVIPTPDELRSMALSAVKDAVAVQVRAALDRGEVISEAEQRRLVTEAWERLKDRLLLGMHPRHFEKPGFLVTGEVGHLLNTSAWDVRAMVGLGVGPVFVAVGASFLTDGDYALVIPAELSVPVLITDGLNAPVVQVFLRGEMPVTGGEDEVWRAVLGARVALDVL